MSELLEFVVVVDQDRQRLSRFVLDTARALGGNSFRATAALVRIMAKLREDYLKSARHIETRLVLDDLTLSLEWNDTIEAVVLLSGVPQEETLQALRTRLKQASESTDTELLILRNKRISADLEQARNQAAEEMAELEKVLAKKKRELQESIRLAEIDSLTGLLNRGAFDSRLRETFLRRQRQDEPMCLLILDLDNFKQINDNEGHQQGDEQLKRVAAAMNSAVREHVDHSCRIGGDEFAVIACTDASSTCRIAENILIELDYCVSIGIAVMQADDTTEALVGRADAALYEAKHSGRGRVVLAEEENPVESSVDVKAV